MNILMANKPEENQETVLVILTTNDGNQHGICFNKRNFRAEIKEGKVSIVGTTYDIFASPQIRETIG